jgi:hypothetical protein
VDKIRKIKMKESISMNGNGCGDGGGESNEESTPLFSPIEGDSRGLHQTFSSSNIAKSTKKESHKRIDSNNGEDGISDIEFEKDLDESISMLPAPKENGYCYSATSDDMISNESSQVLLL